MLRIVNKRASVPWNLVSRRYSTPQGNSIGCLGLTHSADIREKIVSLCKRRGFVFPNSEIYGGLGGSFDYGPLGMQKLLTLSLQFTGAQMKKNIRDKWWSDFVENKADCVGIETPILMHTDGKPPFFECWLTKLVWRASGHLEHFADPVVECKQCKTSFR